MGNPLARIAIWTLRGISPTFVLFATLASGWCGTTINQANRYAYGANIGWIDCVSDTNHGAVIGEYACSGYIYAGNIGWINLGGGTPTNGIYYQNLSTNDFGVNQDGLGNLRGLSYGANIGWINFENTGSPKVDLLNGTLTGFIYSANCGWISLSNALASVRTDLIRKGVDSNGDGMPDGWKLQHFGSILVDPAADPDGDGASNVQEYLDGTDPFDPASVLRITAYNVAAEGNTNFLTWSSVLTRYYFLQLTSELSPPTLWLDSGLGLINPDGTFTSRTLWGTNAAMRFFRVEAIRPLMP